MDSPFLGRGIFGSGWQRQTCEAVESRESPELPLLCEGDISSTSVSLRSLEAARFRVTRNCGDSGVGGPDFDITVTGLCERRRDLVEVDADALREMFELLSLHPETLKATLSDILESRLLKSILSQLSPVVLRSDGGGCGLVLGAVPLETSHFTAASQLDRNAFVPLVLL